MGSYLVVACIAICLGYFLGRYTGWHEGFAEGKTYGPLELRITALSDGVCPLCQTDFTPQPNCEETDTYSY